MEPQRLLCTGYYKKRISVCFQLIINEPPNNNSTSGNHLLTLFNKAQKNKLCYTVLPMRGWHLTLDRHKIIWLCKYKTAARKIQIAITLNAWGLYLLATTNELFFTSIWLKTTYITATLRHEWNNTGSNFIIYHFNAILIKYLIPEIDSAVKLFKVEFYD